MTGRKWTTDAQEAWLRKELPMFLQADSTQLRKRFFVDICIAWQGKWPDPEPTSEELSKAGGDLTAAVATKRQKKDKQVKAWFDNHKRPTLSGKGDQSIDGVRTLLNLAKPRAWQSWQAYADLVYPELKAEIDAGYAARLKQWNEENPEGEKEGERKPIRFVFMNKFLRERYEAESDEMKVKVEEHRKKKCEVGPDEVNHQYQINQKLPLTFATIMENIAKQTGWNITIMAGGPRPNNEGKISTLFYTTGKTKGGQTYEEFLREEKKAEMQDAFDDFLNECFSSEDCAVRAMNDEESQGEEIDKQDDEKNETVDDEKHEGKGSGSKNKQKKSMLNAKEVSSLKGHSKDGDQPKKSEYELQRERNIAQNQALLASIKDPEFQAAMEEIGKGAPVKKKNKTEKLKPNTEQRRTSARLSSVDEKSKSTNGEMKSVNDTSPENKDLVEQAINKVTEKPEDERPEGETQKAITAGGTGSNGEVVQAAMGTTDKAGSGSETVAGSVLPEKLTHMDADGDTAMKEACDSAHHREKEHKQCQDNVNAQIQSSAPFLSPFDSSPSSPATAVDPSAAASPTRDTSPALRISVSDERTPASVGSPAVALSVVTTPLYVLADENLPAYLTRAILAHLRDVSPASAWQDLVSTFLQFERASPPSGKLSTSARPPEVAQWIKRHVNKKHDPVAVSADYPSRFVAWWNAIQPSWRIKPDGSLSREAPARETWTSLKKGGSAGLYVVVMALSWWICKLEAGSNELRAWDIVDDVTWLLSSVMLATPPSGVKRASPDTADDESPPSKRVKA